MGVLLPRDRTIRFVFLAFIFNGVKNRLCVVFFALPCVSKIPLFISLSGAGVLFISHKVAVLIVVLSDGSGVFYGARSYGSRTVRTHPVGPERQIRP